MFKEYSFYSIFFILVLSTALGFATGLRIYLWSSNILLPNLRNQKLGLHFTVFRIRARNVLTSLQERYHIPRKIYFDVLSPPAPGATLENHCCETIPDSFFMS